MKCLRAGLVTSDLKGISGEGKLCQFNNRRVFLVKGSHPNH
jgi:hypothetical protein